MTPLHPRDRIRSALIRRLGGVPYDEHVGVLHERQIAEPDFIAGAHPQPAREMGL